MEFVTRILHYHDENAGESEERVRDALPVRKRRRQKERTTLLGGRNVRGRRGPVHKYAKKAYARRSQMNPNSEPHARTKRRSPQEAEFRDTYRAKSEIVRAQHV